MKNQIFKNAEFGPIRTYVEDGEIYFVGKDVASALGYVHPTKAVTTHVDEEDRIMTETVTITQIAQDYGFSAVRFNELLMRLRIQHKVGGQWILYSPNLNKGYVQSFSSYFVKPDGEVQVKVHTRWTQSGRLFLYEELKKASILPLIELN